MAFVGFLVFSQQIFDAFLQQERPVNVPENSYYTGWEWIELVERVDIQNYRFKIYHRQTGDLKIDAIFTISDPSCIKAIDSTNIYNSISYYDQSIILKKHKVFKSLDCKMLPTEIFYVEDKPDGVIKLEKKIINEE